jgi:hypothetical protein
MTIEVDHAVPEKRWQSLQWQLYTVRGGAFTRYRTAPHWHPPATGKFGSGIHVSFVDSNVGEPTTLPRGDGLCEAKVTERMDRDRNLGFFK